MRLSLLNILCKKIIVAKNKLAEFGMEGKWGKFYFCQMFSETSLLS